MSDLGLFELKGFSFELTGQLDGFLFQVLFVELVLLMELEVLLMELLILLMELEVFGSELLKSLLGELELVFEVLRFVCQVLNDFFVEF